MGTSESFKSTTIVGLLAFSVVALLAITSLAVFDRAPHAAASVGGRMVVDETLVLYFATTSPTSTALKPDLENPVGNDAVISYGEVTLDTDGAILTESPRVAIYVRNISDGPIELTVERDASLDSEPLNVAELVRALFGPMGGEISSAPSYATRIEAGELYAADLGIGLQRAAWHQYTELLDQLSRPNPSLPTTSRSLARPALGYAAAPARRHS